MRLCVTEKTDWFYSIKLHLFFSTCRSLPSLEGRSTPTRPLGVRPAACLLPGSTWAVTPLCWSVTWFWPTLGSTPVKSRLGENTTGARSTLLFWVCLQTHSHPKMMNSTEIFKTMHMQIHKHAIRMWQNSFTMKTHKEYNTHTHVGIIIGSLDWHISSIMLTDLMIRFDTDVVIWFCLFCLGPFGLVSWWAETEKKHRSKLQRMNSGSN